MPGKRVSMRKTREVLRLYFDLKLGQRQVARIANISQSTVHDYLERFTAAGLSSPLRTVGFEFVVLGMLASPFLL